MKRPIDQTYLVSWDDEGIVKAGYTTHRRWRAFVLRGARLVVLYQFPSHVGAFDLEMQFDADLELNGEQAFESAAEAVPYLGNRGGGYLECYRLPKHQIEHVLKVMIEHVPDSAIELYPGREAEHDQPSMTTYVTERTYGRESGN